MTTPKLPWRPGGARGGEMPPFETDGKVNEYVFAWQGRMKIGCTGVNMVFVGDYEPPSWSAIEWWLPKSVFMASLPTEGESDG